MKSEDKADAIVFGALAAVMAISVIAVACAQTAKYQYSKALDDCIDDSHSKAEADDCVKRVNLVWDEAGARPALVVTAKDGGDQ